MDEIYIAEIVNQIHKKCISKLYEFNLMVIGDEGCGKSSLIRSLFRGKIEPPKAAGPGLQEYGDIIEENGVKLRLQCVEVNRNDFRSYLDYINEKLKKHFVDQRRLAKHEIEDGRIHCCIYLIPPQPLRLNSEHIDRMKALHNKVNIVPIINNAHVSNSIENEKLKESIRYELERNGINYFKFHVEEREDEERHKVVKNLSQRFPFAVVGSNELHVDNGRQKWMRTTVTDCIDIDDYRYDFHAAANLLIRHCMYDLMATTDELHYSEFRRQLLKEAKDSPTSLNQMGLTPLEIKRIRCEIDEKFKSDTIRKEKLDIDIQWQPRIEGLKNRIKELKKRNAKQAC